MNPWFPWQGLYKWPLSGDVIQDIAPSTSWLSPQFEINFAGDRQVETKVVADVASYGKQLGILSEALLEVANGNKGEAVNRLETLVDEIEAIKRQHAASLEQKIKSDIETLKKNNPEALKKLLKEYQ